MALFDWLLGRRKAPSRGIPEPLTESGTSERWADRPKPSAVRQPRAPATPIYEAGEYKLTYNSEGFKTVRPAIFLLAVPTDMVMAIDLRKRATRTFRLDRIVEIEDPITKTVHIEPKQFFANHPDVNSDGFSDRYDDRSKADHMMRRMLCQLSALVIMASADGPMPAKHLDLIMAYVKRENGFAVREGWVEKGDKRGVWPIMRDKITRLKPRPEHLDIYIRTLLDDWENPRRVTALSEALSKVADATLPASQAVRNLAHTINNVRKS